MDAQIAAIAALVYTIVIIWLVRRPAQLPLPQPVQPQPDPAGREVEPPRVALPPPATGAAVTNAVIVAGPKNQPTIDRDFAQEPRRPLHGIRAPSNDPPNVQTFTRLVTRPRSRSRSRTRSGVPVVIAAQPSLSTVASSNISAVEKVASSGATSSRNPEDKSSARRGRDGPNAYDPAGKGKAPLRPADPSYPDLWAFREAAPSFASSTEPSSTVASSSSWNPSGDPFLRTPVHRDSVASTTTSSTRSTRSTVTIKKGDFDDENPFFDKMATTPVSSVSRFRTPVQDYPSPSPKSTPSRLVSPPVAYTEDGVAIRKTYRSITSKRSTTITYWYQADVLSDALLDHPPDLTRVSGEDRLLYGDLYYHRTPLHYQFWLWAREAGEAVWLPVVCGYQREDGRYLIITRNDKYPSWVLADAYKRHLKDSMSD